MSTSREQSTSVSPLYIAIQELGTECKLSKEEITQKLTAIFNKVSIINDFDALLTLATKNNNLYALEWLCDSDNYHPAYSVNHNQMTKAIGTLVSYADDGTESKQDEINIKRNMIKHWLNHCDKNKTPLIEPLEKAAQHRNHFYLNSVMQSYSNKYGDGSHLLANISQVLINSKYLSEIWYQLIGNHSFPYYASNAAITKSIEQHHFELTLCLTKQNTEFYPDPHLVMLLDKFKNKIIAPELFYKILDARKNKWGHYLHIPLWKTAIEIGDIKTIVKFTTLFNIWYGNLGIQTPLEMAIEKYNKQLTHFEIVFYLMKHKMRHYKIEQGDINLVITLNKVEHLKDLMQLHDSIIKYVNEESMTLAASHGNLEMVDYLIQLNIPINKKSKSFFGAESEDCPALEIAVKNGHLDIVKLLITKGAICKANILDKVQHRLQDKNSNYKRIYYFIHFILAIQANKFQNAHAACVFLREEDKIALVQCFADKQQTMLQLMGPDIFNKAFQIPKAGEQKALEIKSMPKPSAPDLYSQNTEDKRSTTTSTTIRNNSGSMTTEQKETKESPVTLEKFSSHPKIMTIISDFLLEAKTVTAQPQNSIAASIEIECEPGAVEPLMKISSSKSLSFFPFEKFSIENNEKVTHQLLDIVNRGANYWHGNEDLQKQLQFFCFQKLATLEAQKTKVCKLG